MIKEYHANALGKLQVTCEVKHLGFREEHAPLNCFNSDDIPKAESIWHYGTMPNVCMLFGTQAFLPFSSN